jgi:glycerol-3-phosphate O-acyltransferase
MDASVTLPLWLFVLLLALAAWWGIERLIAPGLRWYLRRRVNKAIEEINERLQLRIPAFKIARREALIDRLIYDGKVVEAAEEKARASGAPRAAVMGQVLGYAREIVPAFNAYLYFRLGLGIARRIARLMYHVRVGYMDEAGLAAVDSKASVVFVMNHRSNMDYVLVGFLVAEKAAISYAVGEWARIWPLQQLIRSMGAYFVRRNSGDPLYRRVMERYIQMATEAGVAQAVFPEGGLTRDGAMRAPKLGILDYMCKGFDPKGERDIVFIPVGINYDRVIEDRSLLRRLDPDARAKSISFVLWTTLRFVGRNVAQMMRREWYRFGYACVNFGTPVSLRDWTAKHAVDFRAGDKDQRFKQVDALARDLMTAIGEVVPVLPVSLVATVLLDAGDAGASAIDVKAKAAALFASLGAAGAHPYIPRRDQDYAIEVGLRHLARRNVLIEEDGHYRMAAGEAPLLAYYANAIAHLLAKARP